jgi:hypothetical protein|uniref:MedDCM-OCT-S28-C70-cds3 n=1 Tax=Candidatus Actinomarina minuta TaxID=1389454 RepID=S5DQ12_9ACTN|nr:MedDCM-OCT-S28-C70-cds3 [Candidatus Actinomarina minuta]|tara:strand:- start:131 stop:409 length:279 start_codon:yes stop_codon:yes gene_type:complete
MSNDFIELLKKSSKVSDSEKWDAEYETLPVVIAESSASLDDALLKLDEVGGYGYVATWRKNLFAFNTKLLSKRCGLIDENGSLLKAARVPKN